ncbi:DUF692 domain-containing protein [soil metagenome]
MSSRPDCTEDRVGLGWRGELAAGILANLDRIDLVELIADDHYHASAPNLRALRTLSTQLPVSLHGVAMGLASTVPVEQKHLDNMARLVDALRPESWSEHLAFVRGGGVEIGHLAAPPRTAQSVEGCLANITRAEKTVGSSPALENIATLIDPPASTLGEAEWITRIICGSNASLLLDLHNLYANALNFGEDPTALMLAMPLDKVSSVHLSGGKWIAEPGDSAKQRLLDDHVHDVPPEVFALLTVLAQKLPQSLTVIIERDGNYPVFDALLSQVDAAREALLCGRRMRNRAASPMLLAASGCP